MITVLLMTGLGVYLCAFHASAIDKSLEKRPFGLTHWELAHHVTKAERGDCISAYRLAQYHLYASLDLEEAEKNFRRAARCQNFDALVGLITILRKPENDAEIDDLLMILKRLDPEKSESALQEIKLRRSERMGRHAEARSDIRARPRH